MEATFFFGVIQSFLVTAIGLGVFVNRGIEIIKPGLLLLEAELTKRIDPLIAAKVIKAIYVVIAIGVGYIVAAVQGVNPFIPCPACPAWVGYIPSWVVYLSFGALVSLGAEILHQVLGFVQSIRDWFDTLKPQG